MKLPVQFETIFGTYTAKEKIGEGGSGVVYGGVSDDGRSVAIKTLAPDRVTSDKRRRFKNEIAFLSRVTSPFLVQVIDQGVLTSPKEKILFYVMPRHDYSLRDLIVMGIDATEAIEIMTQILDGVETAHLHKAIHRDLKPENILYDNGSRRIAIADFGVARFSEDMLITLVETGINQRLANFVYAAPEQRIRGGQIGQQTDIYALGLIINELFTGQVPLGTGYKMIASVAPQYAFLDDIVSSMIRQDASSRPASVQDIKVAIERHRQVAITLQRLDQTTNSVVPEGTISDPLAFEPVKIIGFDWSDGILELRLDRSVHEKWVSALNRMGNHTAVMGIGPEKFDFRGTKATARVPAHSVQGVIDHFKTWMPKATDKLKYNLELDENTKRNKRFEDQRKELAREQEKLNLLRTVRI